MRPFVFCYADQWVWARIIHPNKFCGARQLGITFKQQKENIYPALDKGFDFVN